MSSDGSFRVERTVQGRAGSSFFVMRKNELHRTCLVPREPGGPSGLATALLPRKKADRSVFPTDGESGPRGPARLGVTAQSSAAAAQSSLRPESGGWRRPGRAEGGRAGEEGVRGVDLCRRSPLRSGREAAAAAALFAASPAAQSAQGRGPLLLQHPRTGVSFASAASQRLGRAPRAGLGLRPPSTPLKNRSTARR